MPTKLNAAVLWAPAACGLPFKASGLESTLADLLSDSEKLRDELAQRYGERWEGLQHLSIGGNEWDAEVLSQAHKFAVVRRASRCGVDNNHGRP